MTSSLQQGLISFIDFVLDLKCWDNPSSPIWFDKQNNTIDKSKINIMENFNDKGKEYIKIKNNKNYKLLFFSLNCYGGLKGSGNNHNSIVSCQKL